MPQIVNFFQEKFTLFAIYLELMLTQLSKNNNKMLIMLFFRLGKDKNVVKECTNKMFVLTEDLAHHFIESS